MRSSDKTLNCGGAVLALIMAGVLSLTQSAVGAGSTTTRLSRGVGHDDANGVSTVASMSASGRFVILNSDANNLVSGDVNGTSDVFVHDRDFDRNGVFDEGNAVIMLISITPDGHQFMSPSAAGAVNENGRFVAFESGGVIYVRDRDPEQDGVFDEQNDATIEIALGIDPAISGDGRYIAFTSFAALIGEDTNDLADVYVHDRDPDENGVFDERNGVNVRLSVHSNGVQAKGASGEPTISAGGRHVAFVSAAANLVDIDGNGFSDIFLRDRDPDDNGVFDEPTATTRRVSIPTWSTPEESNGNSTGPSISADGRHIAFSSLAGNIVDDDFNGLNDVFVHDRDGDGNGVLDDGIVLSHRVSMPSDQLEVQGAADQCAISGDGRFIAFVSSSDEMVSGDTNRKRDVFVRDRDVDQDNQYDLASEVATTRISISTSCEQADDDADGAPALSFDGRHIAFNSLATNLDGPDANRTQDSFVRDRTSCIVPSITLEPKPIDGCLGQTAIFEPSFVGTPPFQFQWRRNGVNIPGADAAILTVPAAQFSDEGDYDVVITNDCSCGVAVSDLAALSLPSCPTDINGDGNVDAADLAELLTSWGFCPQCPADITCNFTVNHQDLALLLGTWGPCRP